MPNEHIAIFGAGQMGVAIAAAFLKKRFFVTLYDMSEQAVDTAWNRVEAELALQNTANVAELLANFTCTGSLENALRIHGTEHITFVIETITEKLRVKSRLYAEVVPLLGGSTVLVSNTSTISINNLAATLPNANNMAARFCGFHFFHPVRERSLVEIIRGQATSEETLERAKRLALAIDKTPLVVNDGPGFVVNRLLNAYLSGALHLLTEGATIRQIDAVAEQYGMAMGPFRIMDEIGLDVTMHGGWVLFKAFPDRVEPSPILLELVRDGHLGRKTGCGFYRYESSTMWKSPGQPHAELETMISEKYRGGQIAPLPSVTTDRMIGRSIGEMFREGQRILDDGIVTSSAEVELAVTLGLGFPKDRWKETMTK
ncbi:MAG: 3-hydroxyacyl-CoA dehydrogenase family protein [Planctomycetaceae bacterium]|nr:3-hydroxyacyl-CoA dehydrogenase family protein [Planctomycetaceae bacterium]